ncbi:MAG: ASKHA domain-containing protein [Bacillota bacterium]|nr:ASKHA domain-containing protein [Bacillota bacterium]
MPKVKFIPQNKEIEVDPGTNLLKAADKAGLYIEGDCAGKGTCGKCRVNITEGLENNPSPAEKKFLSENELQSGWVLACQRTVDKNMVVDVPLQKDAHTRKISLAGGVEKLEADPVLEKIAVKLSKPAVKDQTADLERLLGELKKGDLSVKPRELSGLPSMLRNNGFSVTAAIDGNRIISLEPGNTGDYMYGIAFDIGTTTIVGSLLDLKNAEVIAVSAATNPQNIYGADVISRITHASQVEGGLKQLQDKVVESANQIIKNLLRQTRIPKDRVYEIVLVGNTTMSHLFMGIDPTYLAPAPFIPAYSRALKVEASEIGLNIHPAGLVTFLPNIAGYVGSDTVGVILATGMDQRKDNCAAIDIGTNGELVLAANGRLMACSTAAGPAFEGAQIKQGMRAAAGAIETVSFVNEDITLSMIDDEPACGICGSGLIDAAAALIQAGLIEPNGRFVNVEENPDKVPPQFRDRLRRGKSGFEFVLVAGKDTESGDDIVLTQGDVRELQLAKGAIYAGLVILLKEAGISEDDLDQVMLAGAFGNYVRKESALTIGLLPQIPAEKIIAVGNAAGDGAKMALASKKARFRALELPGKVEHLELSTRIDFQEIFVDALSFGKI